MAAGYVTNWGNDNNDGLTWGTAKRSLQGAKDAALLPTYLKGYFNEPFLDMNGLTGIDIPIWDGGNIVSTANGTNRTYTNLYLKNFNKIDGYTASRDIPAWSNCTLENVSLNIINTSWNGCKGTLLHKCNTLASILLLDQNTIHGGGRTTTLYINYLYKIYSYNNIISEFAEIDINISPDENKDAKFLKYSLIINSAFKFTGGSEGADETVYIYPAGNTDIDKLQDLKNRMAIVYGGVAADYLEGCKYYSGSYNDIFQDADNGDFNLKPDSIAVNMAYDGSYIGARPVGQNIPIADFTKTNIDTNGRVIDQNVDANAKSTSIIDLGKIRQIVSWTALGDRAARNGQQINTEENLSAPIAPGSNVLEDAKVYMCINDTITLDDAGATTYNPWETFVAVDEGSGVGLGFSTAGSGQLQEVLIEDYDQKIKIKSSKTDALLSTAPVLTFLLYASPPMVNVDGNGIPTAGDGDTAFDEGTAVNFYTRYLDPDIDIQENNLPAR